jgi:GNAT superfamily N-acetyltransferase
MSTVGAVALRPAAPGDLELLVRHRRRMWEDMGLLPAGAHDPSEDAYRGWLATRLASGEVVGWVAAAEGRPVASGLLWFQACQPRPKVPDGVIPYLMSLWVEPEARRQGLARRITEAAIAEARSRGHRRVGLHASKAGRPLYEALGFRPSDELWLDLPPEGPAGAAPPS